MNKFNPLFSKTLLIILSVFLFFSAPTNILAAPFDSMPSSIDMGTTYYYESSPGNYSPMPTGTTIPSGTTIYTKNTYTGEYSVFGQSQTEGTVTKPSTEIPISLPTSPTEKVYIKDSEGNSVLYKGEDVPAGTEVFTMNSDGELKTYGSVGVPDSAGKKVDCLLGNIQCYFTEAIIYTISGIASAILTLGRNIITAVMDKSIFQGLGNTASDNISIQLGWPIVRNLANAALLIGLIVIAINIILGNKEDESKRNLIKFIITALLINFTPVICSFFIDGSDIIMSNFITGGGISNDYSSQIISARKVASDADILNRLLYTVYIMFFSLIVFTIYCLYSLLFIARSVILWILIIVSPIALATRIFPQSKYVKKIFPSVLFWDDWLEQFIQWCVIGIPAGLFIYISNQMVIGIGSLLTDATTPKTPIGMLLLYTLPLIFLIVGFFITISAGTAAASKISPELTGFGKKALGAVGAAGLGVAGGVAGGTVGVLATGRGGTWIERAQKGYSSGRETAQKEGLINSTVIAGGHVVGGAAGAVGAAGKWGIRRATGTAGKGLVDSVKEGGAEAWKKGAIPTVSGLAGEVAGGTYGAIKGTYKGEDVRVAATEGAKSGRKLAEDTLGVAAARVVKSTTNAASTVFGEMTKDMSTTKKDAEKAAGIGEILDKLKKARNDDELDDIWNGLTKEQQGNKKIEKNYKELRTTPVQNNNP
jgi:hypothetical protein